MQIRRNISKKLLVRMLVFLSIVASAAFFDVYIDDGSSSQQAEAALPVNTKSKQHCIMVQNDFSVLKLSSERLSVLRSYLTGHDKFLRKYHHLRNYQVLKAKVQMQTTPLILSYHYLAFKNYSFSLPDDEPARA